MIWRRKLESILFTSKTEIFSSSPSKTISRLWQQQNQHASNGLSHKQCMYIHHTPYYILCVFQNSNSIHTAAARYTIIKAYNVYIHLYTAATRERKKEQVRASEREREMYQYIRILTYSTSHENTLFILHLCMLSHLFDEDENGERVSIGAIHT